MNVIHSMLFGKRHEIGDEDFQTSLRAAECVVKQGDPTAFLPWLRFFPLKSIKTMKEAYALRTELMKKKIQEHESTFDPNNIRDFTDSLLNVFYQKVQPSSSIYGKFITMKNAGINHMNLIHIDG